MYQKCNWQELCPFLQERRELRQLRLPVDRLHIKTRSPTADYHFAIFVQRGWTMKLSLTFTDEKTKTDIYSKQAARNRCKFVPTLCCLMPSHKESSYIVKSLPNARLPNKWPFRHVGAGSKRAIRGQIDENPPLIDIEQQRCPARRSLCHYNFYFCADENNVQGSPMCNEQCARVCNLQCAMWMGLQWAMCKGLQCAIMSNVQGSPHPDESESGVRRWAERSSHSYKLNCTIQQAEQPKEVKWNAMQRTELRFPRTCLFNCTFLYSSYTILDTSESTRIILS